MSAAFSAGVRRRTLFGLVGAAGAGGLLAACGTEISGKLLTSKLPLPERFVTPLPIPQVAKPTMPGRYDLVQRAVPVEIIPGTRTTIWGYDGTFPGPTFDVKANEPITVRITNELPVPTSTHLHGGVTAHDSDGFPTDLIVPAAIASSYQPGAGSHMPMAGDPMMWTLHTGAREYAYTLNQPAATLWYHDHRMDFTAPQVYRGLAGMFIVRDAASEALATARRRARHPADDLRSGIRGGRLVPLPGRRSPGHRAGRYRPPTCRAWRATSSWSTARRGRCSRWTRRDTGSDS